MFQKLASLAEQLHNSVFTPLSLYVQGKCGSLPEATAKLMDVTTSAENLVGEFRQAAKSTVVMVKDDATGEEHQFEISTDGYGIVVKHVDTGHSVGLEIFDGTLQALAWEVNKDEPVVRHKFPVPTYQLCKHCDHFADEMGHMEDGEQEFDHNPEPDGPALPLAEWKVNRPDLFVMHPDGKIGPNSIHHSRRGKIDE